MKKSIINIAFLSLAIGLVSCSGHTHTFASEWTHDSSNHWHAATCEHKDEKDSLGAHTGGEATYEHGKICEVCGYEYTEKLAKETLFDKTYSYSGVYSDFTYAEGVTKDAFDRAICNFYENATELRLRVASEMGTYGFLEKYRLPYLNQQVKFGSETKTNARTYKGKSVTTYDVNPKDNDKLCEFAIDPENESQYRLLSPSSSDLTAEFIPLKVFDFSLMSGVTKHMVIEDNGFALNEKTIKFNYKVTASVNEIDYVGYFSLNFDNGESLEVNITKQPQDVHVISPNSAKFEVQVDHPELVTGYQWYAGAFNEKGEAISFKPIAGYGAQKNILEIPGIGPKVGHWCYKCLITVNGREFFSDYATMYVDDARDEVPTFFVLDYPVVPGDSLDLSRTPYGTGTIEYSGDGSLITFTDVHFSNDIIETDLESIAFSLTSWNNKVENLTFNFVGENVWNNEYWEEDNNQGGFGLFVHYAGQSIIPTINFIGDQLTVIGGTRAISVSAKLNIQNTINLVGLPGRLTHGIFAYSINVKSGASVSGSLGGNVLYTLSSDNNVWGDIEIESGARVNAVVNPGKVSVGETLIFGIHALGNIKIYDANVTLVMAPDYRYFRDTKQIVMPLIGINSSNGFLEIKNSNVSINMFSMNCPTEGTIETVVNSAMGLDAFEISIANSKIDISIKSLSFFVVNGIYSVMFECEDSIINVDVLGIAEVSGIVSPLSIRDQQTGEFISYVNIKNSKVLVGVYAETIAYDDFGNVNYIDAGIRAKDFEITLGKNDYVEVHTNRASALVSSYARSKVEPIEQITPTHLPKVFTNLIDDEGDSSLSFTYYPSWSTTEESFYVLCEAMYTDSQHQTYKTDLKLVAPRL